MTTFLPQLELPELDYRILDRELDRTKTAVFKEKHAAFLGPLMCSLNFVWDTTVPTAATDGVKIMWNPHYFMALHREGRMSILVHELWHVGLLHVLRRGSRDPRIWNAAADTTLDNMMDDEGYCVDEKLFPVELYGPGCKTFVDHTHDGKTTEEIYEILFQQMPPPPPLGGAGQGSGSGSGNGNGLPGHPSSGDLQEPAKGQEHAIVNNVVSAFHQAKLAGAGNLPGDIEVTLNQFLAPKLPWRTILANFFNELANQDYSWSRPNRRYQDVYLPSLVDDREGLDHLIYYLDVSGSISDSDIVRFHSEFKHVKETYQPEKMTMVQFDTMIQKEEVFEKDDPFEETHVIGRGGTCLICVREHIIKHKPTAVVIFSDMQVAPMEPLPAGDVVPIIWVALNARNVKVPHGEVIHLNE